MFRRCSSVLQAPVDTRVRHYLQLACLMMATGLCSTALTVVIGSLVSKPCSASGRVVIAEERLAAAVCTVRSYRATASIRMILSIEEPVSVGSEPPDWVASALSSAARLFARRAENDRLFPPWWAPSISPNACFCRVIDGKGWPVPAFWCEWRCMNFGAPLDQALGGKEISVGPRDEFSVRAIPLQPSWLGLPFDIAIHGTFWLGIYLSYHWLRCQYRRIRGRCKQCAYDVSQLPHGVSCPECGAKEIL
jgi:hypothetical protein